MNIYELDKDKSYVCEVKITKQVAADELYAYLQSVKNAFDKVGITNIIFIPTGEFVPIEELNIKKDMSHEKSYDH